MVAFAALHALEIFSLVLAAWGWGALLLQKLDPSPSAEREVLRFGAGLATLCYATFVLGLAGVLSRATLLAVLLPGLVLGLVPLIRRPLRPLPGLAAYLLAILLLGVPFFLQALCPPVDWDATACHLAFAKMCLQQHRLVVATYLRYPVFPQFVEMSFTLAMGVYDEIAAQLVSSAMWAGTAVAVYALGKRLWNRAAGVLAAGLWVGGPTGLIAGSIGYVDAGLTFFVCLAALAWVRYAEDRPDRFAALSGAFAGCAAASKYSGLFFIAAFAIASFFGAPGSRRKRATALFLACAALTSLPWYVRNAVVSGDPFFPFLGHWLGLRWWNAGDLQRQVSELRALGGGRSAISFLRLWDRLAFDQGLFVGPEDVFSPSLWIPLPILLVAFWKRPLPRTLLLIAFGFVLLWFASSPSGRYLLPAIPLLCVGMGGILARPLLALPRGALAAVWVSALLFMVPSFWYATTRTALRGLPPTTPESRARFIESFHASYPAYAWLNQERGRAYRVYAWREPYMAYYADGDFLGDWFGPARYRDLEAGIDEGARVYAMLRSLGADYFVVGDDLGPVRVPEDVHLRLVYAGPGARIFAVVDRQDTAQRQGKPSGGTRAQIDFAASARDSID